jgi:hypothetical protein
MSDGRESSVVDVSKSILDDIKTGAGPTSRDESGGYSAYCPGGVRHRGSMSLVQGSRMEHVKARTILRTMSEDVGTRGATGRIPSGRIREGLSTVAGALADPSVVAVNRPRIAVGRGAKGWGRPGERVWSTERDGTA